MLIRRGGDVIGAVVDPDGVIIWRSWDAVGVDEKGVGIGIGQFGAVCEVCGIVIGVGQQAGAIVGQPAVGWRGPTEVDVVGESDGIKCEWR